MANPDVPDSGEPDAAKVATVAAAILGVVLALGGLAVYGAHVGLSVAVGAVIAVANLLTMSAIIRALLKPPDDAEANAEASANAEARADADADADVSADEPRPTNADHVREGKRGGAAWGIFAAVKIVVLFGGIWVLLTRGWVDPIPLVVGYGVLPLGIAISGFATNMAPKNRKKRR